MYFKVTNWKGQKKGEKGKGLPLIERIKGGKKIKELFSGDLISADFLLAQAALLHSGYLTQREQQSGLRCQPVLTLVTSEKFLCLSSSIKSFAEVKQ